VYDIVGFDSNYKTPRFAGKILYAAGAISAASLALSVLCVGMKTSAGSMVADQDVVQIQSEDEADSYAGAGSQLARMLYKALAFRGSAPIFAAAVAEPTGTQATATIAFSGTVTAAGQLDIGIAGETVSVAINVGDSLDTIGANIVNYVNQKLRWPVLADAYTPSDDLVTLKVKNKGVQGKDWILNVDMKQAPAGLTVTVTGSVTVGSSYRVRFGASSTGTGTEDVTNILTKLTSRRYARTALGQNDTTNAALWKSQVDALGGSTSMVYDQLVFATNKAYSTASTLSAALNHVQSQILWYRNSESHWCEIAAAKAVLRANTEGNGQPPDYDAVSGNGVLVGIAAIRAGFESDLPSDTECNTALNAGITPITNFNGAAATVRSITSYYSFNGTPDYRVIDIGDPVVAEYVTLDMQLGWQTEFKAANPYIQDNPPPGAEPLPAKVGSPALWNAFAMRKLKQHQRDLRIEDPELNPPDAVFNSTAKRIQGVIPFVPLRVQHQIGIIMRQQSAA